VKEFVQLQRKHMQAQHRESTNFAAARRRRRLFTEAQIKAIRTDQRPARRIAASYGVGHKLILGIRSRRYYADV
jgi:hypothetical protein